MKPESFKAKITLLSVSLSGIVLVAFGLFFLAILHRIEMGRIDREMKAFTEGQLSAPRPPEYWSRLHESLRHIYGNDERDRLLVQVRDASGRGLYTSPNWPAALRVRWPVGTLPETRHPPGMPPRPDAAWRDKEFEAAADPFSAQGTGPRGVPGPERHGPGGERRGAMRGRMHVPPVVRPPELYTSDSADGPWRICLAGNQFAEIATAMHMGNVQGHVRLFRNAFLVSLPVALLLLALGGRYLARRALWPVQVIAKTADRISAHGLNRRIPAMQADAEFDHLIKVVNSMLERLETGFHQSARFSSDAAHELKTPLTVLQGELENALNRADAGSPEQQTYNNLLEEVQRLKVITQKLLLLSRADAGQLSLERTSVDFGDAVSAATEDIEILAPQLSVEQSINPGITVSADPDLLRQLIQNLVTNAVRYNKPQGWIRLALERNRTRARLSITNSSDRLDAIDENRIFSRFYRADPSRTRSPGRSAGTGLGLSLAREIARAHGGDLKVGDLQSDTITFTLTLPVED